MSSTKPKSTTNPTPPVTTPRASGGHDNWLIMQIGELSGDIKALTASIDHLREKIVAVESDTATIKTKVERLDKIIFSATAVITLIIAVGGFVANKAIDFGLDMAKQAHSAQTQTAPQQPPLAQPTQQSQPAQTKKP